MEDYGLLDVDTSNPVCFSGYAYETCFLLKGYIAWGKPWGLIHKKLTNDDVWKNWNIHHE